MVLNFDWFTFANSADPDFVADDFDWLATMNYPSRKALNGRGWTGLFANFLHFYIYFLIYHEQNSYPYFANLRKNFVYVYC